MALQLSALFSSLRLQSHSSRLGTAGKPVTRRLTMKVATGGVAQRVWRGSRQAGRWWRHRCKFWQQQQKQQVLQIDISSMHFGYG